MGIRDRPFKLDTPWVLSLLYCWLPNSATACGGNGPETKTNPIGVAEYQLQAQLPAALKGGLPTAKQVADAVRDFLPPKQ